MPSRPPSHPCRARRCACTQLMCTQGSGSVNCLYPRKHCAPLVCSRASGAADLISELVPPADFTLAESPWRKTGVSLAQAASHAPQPIKKTIIRAPLLNQGCSARCASSQESTLFTMATQSSWLGARVVSSDNLYKGTVRFEGELGDGKLAGLWLGVEWDDPARGTHDGTLDGVRRFHCVRAGSGSFVRPGKVLLGTTFAHEFLQRYNTSEDEYKHIKILNPRDITNMTQAIMSGKRIALAGDMPSVAPFVSNLTSLDLSDNLFLGVADIAAILAHTPSLTFLAMSNNALVPDPPASRDSDAGPREADQINALPSLASLSHLRLSGTALPAWLAARWLRRLPALSELHFCANGLQGEREVRDLAESLPPRLHTLFFNDNALASLREAVPLGRLPGLRVLSLGGNPLTTAGFEEETALAAAWDEHAWMAGAAPVSVPAEMAEEVGTPGDATHAHAKGPRGAEADEDWATDVRVGSPMSGDDGGATRPVGAGVGGGEPEVAGPSATPHEAPLSATRGLFPQLQSLFLSDTAIAALEELDCLRCLPSLRDVRVQGTPLARSLPEQDAFKLLVAALPHVATINGSRVLDGERQAAERAAVRYWHGMDHKPRRYWELVETHGELAPLADVDLSPPPEEATVTLDLFGQDEVAMVVRTEWKVMELVLRVSARCGVAPGFLQVSWRPRGDASAEEPLECPGLRLSRWYDVRDGDWLVVRHAKYGAAVPE